jgi:hypothetical protein
MLKIPHCLDNRLRDGGKVVSPTHRQNFTPQKQYYFSVSGTHFAHNYYFLKTTHSLTEFLYAIQEGDLFTNCSSA